jgi:glucose-6-phosphate 1-dehydrogenase
MQLDDVEMDFAYGREFEQRMPEAYERLLLDALRGDASLYTRSDEVDYAWRYISQVLEGWNDDKQPLLSYAPGSDGPVEADLLLAGTGAKWRPLVEM